MDAEAGRVLDEIREAIASNRLLLPSLPEVALRVRSMTLDEACSASALEREIAKDAAITARLLKVANSSAMSRGTPLTSLRAAINRLGFSLVRSLVTQLSILQSLQGDQEKERLQGFVASGLRISALCHTLAQHHPHLDPEQAALGGLLHDIGKLPLRRFLTDHPAISNDSAIALEQQLHPAVGGILLTDWRFPPELIQVAEEHEEVTRDAAPLPDYTDLTIAANLLHYGTEQGRYAHLAGVDVPALRKSVPETDNDAWETCLDKRMALSLQMISA